MKYLYLIILGIIFIPKISFGAVMFDATTASSTSSGTTLNINHTITTASSSPAIVVYIYEATASSISSITYDGTALTFATSTTPISTYKSYLYTLNNPTTGTKTLTITRSGSTGLFKAIITSYTGVSPYIPIYNAYNTKAANTGSYSIDTTTVVDNSLLGLMIYGDNNANYTAATHTIERNTGVSGLETFEHQTLVSPAGLENLAITSSAQWGLGISYSLTPATTTSTTTTSTTTSTVNNGDMIFSLAIVAFLLCFIFLGLVFNSFLK